MLLKEEGNDGGVGQMARLVIDQPPLKLEADQLARINRKLVEESGEPGVVHICKLIEVSPLMSHHPRVHVVQQSVGVRHFGHLLPIGAI